MNEKLVARLQSPGPKRLLALDGGGIRGVLTLEFLERIEAILASRSSNPEQFRLSDYFDLIGGTSTGSIIASMLACGHSVSEIKELYRVLAKKVFKHSVLRQGLIVSKFPKKPLETALERYLGKETTLGSEKIRTGLMIMTKRLDTGSPWPLHNCPFGTYYNPKSGSGSALANKDFLLTQVVLSSTAAPHYFEPERIVVAKKVKGGIEKGAFVDGGVSPSNNPALQLFMLATLEGYGFRWPLGADNILLVSVGTGSFSQRLTTEEVTGMPAAQVAFRSLLTLMDDCDALVQTMLQWMAHTPTPWHIDREIKSLENDRLGREELLTYLRYNVKFDENWLKENMEMDLDKAKIKELEAMDNSKNIDELADAGRKAAQAQISDSHFPRSFDC